MKVKLVLCLCLLEQKGQSLGEKVHFLGEKVQSIGKKVQSIEKKIHFLGGNHVLSDERGFGMNELLGIAAALILAAFIIIPSLKTFAQSIMNGLGDWWDGVIVNKIFPTSI